MNFDFIRGQNPVVSIYYGSAYGFGKITGFSKFLETAAAKRVR